MARTILGLFKLRIGVVIMLTALAGFAVTPYAVSGVPTLSPLQITILALAVLTSSASAGAFNQYFEHDTDRLMRRTSKRPFVTGELKHGPLWLALICVLLCASVAAAWQVANPFAALYVFLGAFFYAIVYTVWLKRRTWLNIVIGGLAGSFAVLAGAAAANPALGTIPLLLSLVLFLWTPPHFWSLAIANQSDYAAAGVPMLPVVVGEARAARIVYASTLTLVGASLLPLFFGAGPLYATGALSGGIYFTIKARQLAKAPSRETAMASFFASMLQLGLLLAAAILEALVF